MGSQQSIEQDAITALNELIKLPMKLVWVWKFPTEIASATPQMEIFRYKDVAWTIRTFHLPHPSNPQLDKIHIQISRNVATTRYDLQMFWYDDDKTRYELQMASNDVISTCTISRCDQKSKHDVELHVYGPVDDNVEEEETCKIWMDEVEGMGGMTREDNWQLMNNRVRLWMDYDSMMPGTSEQGMKLWDCGIFENSVDRWKLKQKFPKESNRLNTMVKVVLDPMDSLHPKKVVRPIEKKVAVKESKPRHFRPNNLLTFPRKQLPMETLAPVQMKKEQKVERKEETVTELSAEELRKKEEKKARNKKTRDAKKAKKEAKREEEGKEKEEMELGRNDDDKSDKEKLRPRPFQPTNLLTFPDELPPMKVLTPVQMKKEEQPVEPPVEQPAKSKVLEKQEARNMELKRRKEEKKKDRR